MNRVKIRTVVVLGLVGIVGIIIIQIVWFKNAFSYEKRKFNQTVQIALLDVVKDLYGSDERLIPLSNPVRQVSDDYYVIDINKDFDPEILDYYLKKEFEQHNLTLDFEYAMYDCTNDDMVYGKKIEYDNNVTSDLDYFPKSDNLVYYFAVRFPQKGSFLFFSMDLWIFLSLVLLVILMIYVYSIFIILQQNRYVELQKDFINNMTHEFKTPISSILIASNYLKKRQEIAQDDKLLRYSETIGEQGKKLNSHMERILNLAKSDHDKLELNKQWIDAAELLDQVIDEFRIRLPEVEFTFNSKSEHTLIFVDKDHFTNLLSNLIDNAVKYSIEKPVIDIHLKDQDSEVVICIKDQGKGISKEHLKFVFKKFYRITSDKDHVNGFGIGLYYVKKICDLHKIKLDIESQVGEGTAVSLTIPKPKK